MKRLLFVPLLACICLPAAYAQAWKRLHHKAILVDTHNDVPSVTVERKLLFDSDLTGKTHSDLNRMLKGGVDVQMFSIFCGPEQASPFAFANQEMDSVYAWAQRNPTKMVMVHNSSQLKQAVRQKKLAAMLGVEGGHMIENSLEKLQHLYNRGARYLTLTWNNSTDWASSAKNEEEQNLPHYGLSPFGKNVVRTMDSLGMMVDISHLGEKSFWDVMAISTKPVIASHSCVWSLCPHRRNLKDDQIQAIARSGGVVMLNFYAGFLDSSYERKVMEIRKRFATEIETLTAKKIDKDYATMMVLEQHKDALEGLLPPLSLLLDHIDYIVQLVGIDYVGLGSDFDGVESLPKGITSVLDYEKITEGLKQRGYSNAAVKKILGKNFLRVLKATEKNR